MLTFIPEARAYAFDTGDYRLLICFETINGVIAGRSLQALKEKNST